jgi:serine/threonine-protein kinase HipA
MPEKLYVHADLGDGSILLAGQLIVDDKLGRFKYSKAYIDHPRAFALDPINLPLNADIHVKHRTRETPAMFGVMIDAGPDEWGRRWLTKTRQPPPVTQVEFLLAASGEGVGALHFTSQSRRPGAATVRATVREPGAFAAYCRRYRCRQGSRPRAGALFFPRQRHRRCATQVADRTRRS